MTVPWDNTCAMDGFYSYNVVENLLVVESKETRLSRYGN